MALLEDPNVCAICGRAVSGHVGGVPVYYCPECFRTYHADIVTSEADGTPRKAAPWVVFVLGDEKARRKRRNRLLLSVGLPRMQHTYQGVAL